MKFLGGSAILLKVAVIGLGHMGKLHLMNAQRIDGVNVVAAADKIKGNRKFAEKYHVKTYEDYYRLIEKEQLDAVILSLPNFAKKEAVDFAAENNLDIFLDKPLARNFAEAQNIVRKVEKEKVRLMVGVNYRHFENVQKIKNNLEDGKIGDAVTVTSELVMNGPLSHSLVPTPIPGWWFDKKLSGGGALLDLGYHLIDLMVWMFGDLEVTYSKLGYLFNLPIEDTGTLVLESKKHGPTCLVSVGWFSKSIFPDFNFIVNINGTVGNDSTYRYTPRNLHVHAVKEAALNICRKILRRPPHYLTYTYYYSSFYRIMELFLKTLNREAELPISLIEQLNVIRIIDSVYSKSEAK